MEAPPPPAGCMVRAGACKNGQGGKPGAEGGVGAAAFPGTGQLAQTARPGSRTMTGGAAGG